MTTPSHKQHYRLSPAASALYVGPEGEVIVQLVDFVLRVQDGVTPGGFITVTKNYVDANFLSPSDVAPVALSGAFSDLTGVTLSGNTTKLVTWSGATTGTGIPDLDGSGNLHSVYTISGNTTVLATKSGSWTAGHFTGFDASGNIIDSGLTKSGNGSVMLSASGSLTGGGVLSLDGAGNARSIITVTGNTSVLPTFSGSATTGQFTGFDASGNLAVSGYGPASFDAAGLAATASAHADALAAWTWSGANTLATGITVFNHALGLDPLRCGVRAAIICTSTDAGYAVGDVVHLSTSGPANSSNNLLTILTDAAGNNTGVIVGVGVTIAHKSTFASTNLTLNKWNLYIGVIPNH